MVLVRSLISGISVDGHLEYGRVRNAQSVSLEEIIILVEIIISLVSHDCA